MGGRAKGSKNFMPDMSVGSGELGLPLRQDKAVKAALGIDNPRLPLSRGMAYPNSRATASDAYEHPTRPIAKAARHTWSGPGGIDRGGQWQRSGIEVPLPPTHHRYALDPDIT